MLHGGGFAAGLAKNFGPMTARTVQTRRRSGRLVESIGSTYSAFSICPVAAIDTRAPRTSACSTSLRRWKCFRDNIARFGGDPAGSPFSGNREAVAKWAPHGDAAAGAFFTVPSWKSGSMLQAGNCRDVTGSRSPGDRRTWFERVKHR